MNEHEWNAMNDRDFDALLAESVSELPPDDIARGVKPWKKAMSRILWGLALNAITLEFFYLNYILPTIGMVLLLLGFRTLRRENGWFATCFGITVLRALYFFPMLVLDTTIFKNDIVPPSTQSVLLAANVVLLLIQLFCFWRGLCAVKQKVGLPPTAGAAFALIVWYALVCILLLANFNGSIVAVIMLVAYFCIIVSLCKLSWTLDEAGYSVKPAAVKVTDLAVVLTLAALLIIGGTAGYIFGSSYDMNWHTEETAVTDKTQEIKAHLVELGFPEYVLNDLTEDDIAACEGALQVISETHDEPVNDGSVRQTTYNNAGEINIYEETVYDVNELRVTGVAVQVPAEDDSDGGERWLIFHHFLWTQNPGFPGTESIQLWPAYQQEPDCVCYDGDVTGRVLYDKGGVTYTAPYYWLGDQTYISAGVFDFGEPKTEPFAAFSLPSDGEKCRGYVVYPVQAVPDDFGFNMDSYALYTHQKTWWQYPAQSAMQSRIAGASLNEPAFKTVTDSLLFSYSTEAGIITYDDYD